MGFGRDGGRDGESGRDEKMTAEPIRHRAVIPYSPTHSQNFYDGSGDGWVTAVTDRMTDEMPSFHPSLPRVRGGRDERNWRTMPPDADMPSAPAEPSPSTRDEIPPTSVDDWLRQALRPGPRDAGELKAEAQAAGFSVRTLYRAVKRLGVESSSGGFGQPRVWRLQREKTHADG